VQGTSRTEVADFASRQVLVVCIGNSLAGDDGVGQAVYEELRADSLPGGAHAVLLGLGGVALLEHLQAYRLLIVVDAVQLGGPAGGMHVRDLKEIPAAEAQAVSLHGIGLRETLDIAREIYPERIPARILLVGIEGRRFSELGVPLSDEVAAAIGTAVAEVKRQITAALRSLPASSTAGHNGDSQIMKERTYSEA